MRYIPKVYDYSSLVWVCFFRFPGNEELLLFKVQVDWAPAKDFSAINAQLKIFLDSADTDFDRVVCVCASRCEDAGWTDGAMQLYEYWKDVYPKPEAIIYFQLPFANEMDVVLLLVVFMHGVKLSNYLLSEKHVVIVSSFVLQSMYRNLAVLYHAAGRYDDAAQCLTRAIEFNPELPALQKTVKQAR